MVRERRAPRNDFRARCRGAGFRSRCALSEEPAMTRPLEGIKVVELAMWGFVPSAGAVLSDWGAAVTKIEPHTGDPMRGLNYSGIAPGAYGFTFMWEIFNRGKRSVAMDLAAEGASELFYKLVDGADVFLTSFLPAARRKLRVDADDLVKRNPGIIYAVGSGQGAHGDDAEKGGYDAISFWARSGIASAVTPSDAPYPLGMPGGAFGDALSGALLAGGIAAAIAQRERTGRGSVVDSALLASGMWALQPGIVGAKLTGVAELPKAKRAVMPNPLVNNYRTSDGRFVALCMLQGQRYWPGFCRAIGREDLAMHPDFASDALRAKNIAACIAALDEVFAKEPLAHWKRALATQEGQWDVVQQAGELSRDPQALANGYLQDVDYGDGRTLTMVSSPIQFDRAPSKIRPAPELGAHTDEVMLELGLDMEQVIEAKAAGILL
jgi:crotonobetainyl-CoA:carnitine CoA-transferase CaiB-like acyl-CoA transferase